jgi:hypothetical protein
MMSHPKSLKPMLRRAAPPMKPCNLVSRMRRIRWELAITQDRTSDPAVAGELARLVKQTDEAIDRIESKHQERAQ